MKAFAAIVVSLLYRTVVSGQNCTAESLQSRYKECLDQFVDTFYRPTTNGTASPAACTGAKDAGVACVTALITECSGQVSQLTTSINPSNAEKAFQLACDSSDDVSLANRCYKDLDGTGAVRTCELAERQRLAQIRNPDGNNVTTAQTLCLLIDAHSKCVSDNLKSQCNSQSTQFITMVTTLFATDCQQDAGVTKEEKKSECSDDAVMVNFTACIKPFFDRIEKLELDKEKCNQSILETLKCAAAIVRKCAKTEFRYIQKLLDLGRMKTALDFGCARNWELSEGSFCYNKHYGSDIKPCLEKKMASEQIYASDKEKSVETVCRYIDATTDCTRSGMETCKDSAVTFTEYVRIFFPQDCTDDKGSASSLSAVLGLVTSLLFVHML